jgi:hypothetical protein
VGIGFTVSEGNVLWNIVCGAFTGKYMLIYEQIRRNCSM